LTSCQKFGLGSKS